MTPFVKRFLAKLSILFEIWYDKTNGRIRHESTAVTRKNHFTHIAVHHCGRNILSCGNGNIDENSAYTSSDEVAAYLNAYGRLPENFITKDEAKALGWDSTLGNLNEVAPGKSIGGDRFGNYEGLLPEKEGRIYYECDINYNGGFRGRERLVWSNDGLIYYSGDHYESFTLLYGTEEANP